MGMATLSKLIESTTHVDLAIHASNEDLVATIQQLSDSESPRDRQRLSEAQEQLFSQNAGLIIKIATRYNRGKALTPDETSEVAMSVFVAARHYDPERGQFSSCLPWYIKSALQHEHAFTHERSQSVYARATAKLNNAGQYSRNEVETAASILRPSARLSFEDNGLANMLTDHLSAEEMLVSSMDEVSQSEKRDRLLACVSEAVDGLSDKQRAILTLLLEPRSAKDDLGVSSTRAIAGQLHIPEERVSEEKLKIVLGIQHHLADKEPDLCPERWTSPIEITDLDEGFILDLFGEPVREEVMSRRSPRRSR
jgi:RNA polymerase sigma factor (sigma-70 family)